MRKGVIFPVVLQVGGGTESRKLLGIVLTVPLRSGYKIWPRFPPLEESFFHFGAILSSPPGFGMCLGYTLETYSWLPVTRVLSFLGGSNSGDCSHHPTRWQSEKHPRSPEVSQLKSRLVLSPWSETVVNRITRLYSRLTRGVGVLCP